MSALHSSLGFRAATVAVLVVCAGLGCADPVKIGVMLNVGDRSAHDTSALDWALETINAAGGVAGGRTLELVVSEQDDAQDAMTELIGDPAIAAVIGPRNSQQLLEVAPTFIASEVVLVSPTSTAGEVFRIYGGKDYIWRTTESDVAQLEMLLLTARDMGAQRVSLLAGFDTYGATFFDWFGFFAFELGLEVASTARFDQTSDSCNAHVLDTLYSEPDVLIAAGSDRKHVACIARAVYASGADTRVLFTDTGYDEALVTELGDAAEGLEGLTLAAAPASGFEIAYDHRYHRNVPNYAANMYDAVLLLAYGLEYSGGEAGRALVEGMQKAVSGRGPAADWQIDGIRQGLADVKAHKRPDLSGATGPLTYDHEHFTDLTETVYGHWRVEAGHLHFADYLATGSSELHARDGMSIFRAEASEQLRQEAVESDYRPAEALDDLWVFIAALSVGWDNYRHQADALAQYQMFKARGVDDDHIIMIGADDLAASSKNAEPGVVRNRPGGPNVHKDVVYDYHPGDLSAMHLLQILAGDRSGGMDPVIESDAASNIYVFLVGHGGASGLALAAETAEDATTGSQAFSMISPNMLRTTLLQMHEDERYRRIMIAVEACHAGVMGQYLDAPGTLLLAAANPGENSLSFGFDHDLGAWTADQFAYQLLNHASSGDLMVSVQELYELLYLSVSGSHVTLYNAAEFGDVTEISIEEFMYPLGG